jgi:hypothetical protein
MTVTLRVLTNTGDTTKGAPLSNAEIDQNFISLGTNPKFNGNEGLKLPAGTTSQRASTPQTGELRFNTELGTSEIYNGAEWTSVGGSDVFAKTVALIGL